MPGIRVCAIHIDIRVFSSSDFFLTTHGTPPRKELTGSAALILNAEIELKSSLLRKDALMLNDSILLFWGCLESKTIKPHHDD